MRKLNVNRRGITAVLAMVYLMLFSTLAIGFFAAVTTSVQIARNERQTNRALIASESGMQFMKYELGNLGVPPDTDPAQLFTTVFARLGVRLNNTENMPTASPTVSMNVAGDLISIPGVADTWISCSSTGETFRATVEPLQNGQKLLVKVYGRYDTLQTSGRQVQLEYAVAQDAARIFNFGLASKSSITMGGNVTIRGTPGHEAMGSVLSATTSTNVPLTMTGNAKISGDVSFVNANATPSISSNSTIAGYTSGSSSFSSHVHKGVPEVEFPKIDTTAFAPYVPSASAPAGPQVITGSNPSGTSFKNIRIKAGANPTFNANTVIQGVIYVESPNQVKFNGGAQIQGVIVTATDTNNNASLDVTENIIEFKGSVQVTGVETLPATSDFPAGLRALTGSMMLVPGFDAKFGGDFGTVGGSIIASKMEFSGTAGGTIKGSVINLRDSGVSLAGTSDIIIESQGTANYPAGVFFSSHYAPLPFTYAEATP